MAVTYEPIRLYRTVGEGAPKVVSPPENAGMTLKAGVPIMLTAGIAEEASFGAANTVHGVNLESAHNLAVDGTAEELSIETPPNQPSAKVIPLGAPIKDGTLKCYAANGLNEFTMMLKDGQTYSAANLNIAYGITKDGVSGYWYCDTTDVVGDNVVVKVVGVDPSSPNTVALGARVVVQFLSTKRDFA